LVEQLARKSYNGDPKSREVGLLPDGIIFFAANGELPKVKKAMGGGQMVDEQDQDGMQALHYAAGNGFLHVVLFLVLERRANVAAACTDGSTPLHHACYQGRIKVVQWLLERGGKELVEARDKAGWLPVHAACVAGHVQVLEVLHQASCSTPLDVTIGTEEVQLIHVAARKGHLAVVRYLVLQAGREIDACDPQGASAIHHASSSGHLDLVTWLLLKQPTLVDTLTHAGKRPLDLAEEAGHAAVVKHLVAFAGVCCGPFGFLNIGMFAKLASGTKPALPGEVFACIEGHAVKQRGQGGRLVVIDAPPPPPGCIVLDAGLPLVELVGMSDEMPFVTPDKYNKEELLSLFPRNQSKLQKQAAVAEAEARGEKDKVERAEAAEAEATAAELARKRKEEAEADQREESLTRRKGERRAWSKDQSGKGTIYEFEYLQEPDRKAQDAKIRKIRIREEARVQKEKEDQLQPQWRPRRRREAAAQGRPE